jgi:hypothetical protein
MALAAFVPAVQADDRSWPDYPKQADRNRDYYPDRRRRLHVAMSVPLILDH